MHGPTGFSGLHTVRNRGHSFGAIMPRSTSPQRQPRGFDFGVEAAQRVELRVLLADAVAATLNRTQPAPGGGAGLEYVVDRG